TRRSPRSTLFPYTTLFRSVAVNAKKLRGARLVAVGAVQDAFDEPLLELLNGFVEKDSPLHHLIDEPFQLIFHDVTLRWDVGVQRSEEHTSELQSLTNLVCR